MRHLTPLVLSLMTLGCGTARPPVAQPPPTAASAGGRAAAPSTAPVPTTAGSRRVQGEGWSASVPDAWTESHGDDGGVTWSGEIAPDRPGRRVFGVQRVHETASFDELLRAVGAQYRQDGNEVGPPRVFEQQGQRVAEFEVHQPGQVQQSSMYLAVLVEGRRGLVVSCGGEGADGFEQRCRAVIQSAWFGADANAQPRARAPAGTRWLGAQGRHVQVPADWQPVHEAQTDGTAQVGVADAGEHHAVVLFFLNDLVDTPQEVIEASRRGFADDRANTIVRTEAIRSGRRQGLLIEGTRAVAAGVETTLFQRVIPAGHEAYITVNIAGPRDDLDAHRALYLGIMDSFTLTR